MTDDAAGDAAGDGGADDRGREEDAGDGADGDAGPGAVLGRLLGLVDADLAVLLLDHGRVEGADEAGGVEVEDGLVVGFGVGDVVVDGGVEKDGAVGHAGASLWAGVEPQDVQR